MFAILAGVPGKLKTVLDRLTATRAANLDKLDANITTRAPASTALSNTVWTDARAGKIDAGPIKTVYRGYVSDSSDTATITIGGTVNPAKCVVILDATYGEVGNSDSTTAAVGRVQTAYVTGLTSTTLSIAGRYGTYRRGSGTASFYVPVGWQVIEYN